MIHIFTLVQHSSQLMARGGGGGSGGGGGGGGGGGIAAVGYIPAHFITQWCVRRFNRKIAVVVGSITAIAVTLPFIIAGTGLSIIIGIGAIVGVYSGLNNWLGRLRTRVANGKKAVNFAASVDPAWHEEALKARISKTFYAYQQDWSTFNLQNIQGYTTPRYFQHVQLMMTAMYQMGRRNAVDTPQLLSSDVVDVIDQLDNSGDSFSALVSGKANDKLINTVTNEVIYTDNSAFEEFWWFSRTNNDWMLSRIDQATANVMLRDATLEKFAEENGMFYSLDWGWLLLPQRGQLFSKASFKNSDINNHVIGNWGGLIVQFYTYVPRKNNTESYLIAQITLPKSYGGIIIRRKSKSVIRLWNFAPRGYRKVTMEWPDFNKRYEVFATDMDKVTSFELLNPKFMADLYDKELQVSIEVVDNVVYMYAPLQGTLVSGSQDRYKSMLQVLAAAYHELHR